MKKFISTEATRSEHDKEIKKILENNDRILIGLMVLMTMQFTVIAFIF